MTGSGEFADHFSGHAVDYARYRPHYPRELYALLAEIAPARDVAWDCATGNGQAARALSEHFARVIATDASAEQIAQAHAEPRVEYQVGRAEQSGLPDDSVDLITVAQALHWFDADGFYAEARRVARADAVIAIWSYALCLVDPEVDAITRRYYDEIVGEFWPSERRHVEAGYTTIPFPFSEESVPPFAMEAHWDADDFLGYLGTWSATARYRRNRGEDPLLEIAAQMRAAWGSTAQRVTWPLTLRVGRI